MIKYFFKPKHVSHFNCLCFEVFQFLYKQTEQVDYKQRKKLIELTTSTKTVL